MAQVVILYKSEDAEFVRLLAEALERLGFTVWSALKLTHGYWPGHVAKRIDEAACVIVVLSPQSVDLNGDFVHSKDRDHAIMEKEIKHAEFDRMIPVKRGECMIPKLISGLHCFDLTTWKSGEDHDAFSGLVDGLRELNSSESMRIRMAEMRATIARQRSELQASVDVRTLVRLLRPFLAWIEPVLPRLIAEDKARQQSLTECERAPSLSEAFRLEDEREMQLGKSKPTIENHERGESRSQHTEMPRRPKGS